MKQEEKIYRKAPGFNNSLLTACASGLKELRNYLSPTEREKNKHKVHFRKGLVLDCRVLNPSEFIKDVVVAPPMKEDATNVVLLKECVKRGITTFNPSDILAVADSMELWGNIKDPAKRILRVDTSTNREIFQYLIESTDKTYVSIEELNQLKVAENALLNHPNTKWFFNYKDDSVERKTQVAVYMRYDLPKPVADINDELVKRQDCIVENGYCVAVILKGLLDIVVIDHDSKEIYPNDLKSTSKPAGQEFRSSFIDYGYFRQGSMYDKLIRHWRDENYPGYNIQPFRFIVKSLEEVEEPPLVFTVPENAIKAGEYGGTIGWKKVKGWAELLSELLTQYATGQLYLTADDFYSVMNSGEITLNVFSTNFEPKEDTSVADYYDNSNMLSNDFE